MATQKFIDTITWWYNTGRVSLDYVQNLVPDKLTQDECNEILGVE